MPVFLQMLILGSVQYSYENAGVIISTVSICWVGSGMICQSKYYASQHPTIPDTSPAKTCLNKPSIDKKRMATRTKNKKN